MDEDPRFVPVQLANGAVVRVQLIASRGEEDIANKLLSFAGLGAVIEGISQEISQTIDHLKPQKASLEFGLAVGLEAGQLTAVLVKGSGTASLKVTLEWSRSSSVA